MPISAKKFSVSLSILLPSLLVGSYISYSQPASAQNCVEPPSGLVSWWSGDTFSGETLPDIKGKNNGTLFTNRGLITNVPGKVGNAIKFGGISGLNGQQWDYGTGPIRMGNPANLNFGSGPFSLETWFYWPPPDIFGGHVAPIITKSNAFGSSPGPGYWLRVAQSEGGSVLEFHVGDNIDVGHAVARRATTPVVSGVWNHAVATMDRDVMKLYLNGELKSTVEMKGTPEVLDARTTSDALFTIGQVGAAGQTSSWPFRGFIDEVSVYKKALSQSEIKAIFNADSAGKCKPQPSVSATPIPSKTPVPVTYITYPIAELGNCTSQQDCKNYCDISSNYSKCAAFAKQNNLTILVPAVYTAMENGESPGQCKDEASCRNYCEDIDHIEECVGFIEKFKLASPDDLKEIRQMADVKKSGVAFPGNCKSKESCMKYCDGSAHAVECMEFGLKAGFIPKEDTEAVSKILLYLKSGGKMPSGCTRKESCDAYCSSEAHSSECADFAVGAGFMTKEEAEIMKKTGGKGPGNCKSREACENYCKDETHIDECVDFGVKAGFISAEDAAMAKKFKITSGPGGCKGKAECQSFCVTNQDVCIKWGKEHGIDMGGGQGGPSTAEECAKFSGSWDGKKCELGASECVKQGGTWGPDKETGKETCNFGGEMGQDIRKELEACLGKKTCAEFNSCFDSLSKGNQRQGPGQSSGQGQQKEQQDENGKKIEARARACIDEKMDACLNLSCSEFAACTKSLQQGSPEQGTGDQKQEQSKENPKFNAKMKVCQEEIKAIQMKEIQAKQTACLSRSCSEFESCLKSLQQGGDQGGDHGDQQGQGTPDPAVNAKVQTCQKEKVNACLSKSCGEFQACLNSLGGGGDQGGEQQGPSDPAVESKFMTCFPPPPTGDFGPKSGDQQQQYPLLIEHSFLGAIVRYLFR